MIEEDLEKLDNDGVLRYYNLREDYIYVGVKDFQNINGRKGTGHPLSALMYRYGLRIVRIRDYHGYFMVWLD